MKIQTYKNGTSPNSPYLDNSFQSVASKQEEAKRTPINLSRDHNIEEIMQAEAETDETPYNQADESQLDP